VKLVFIYGVPGVGKLTTARVLAALTGFKVFHNHLSFNLVNAIFDFPSPPFGELANERRVVGAERLALGKIATVESLRRALGRWNLTSLIADRATLDIDNSTLAAETAARRIADHFSLPVAGGEAKRGARS
jgi:hypothetical protein